MSYAAIAAVLARSDLQTPARRLEQLLEWPLERSCPQWRLIEAWTHAAHGPYMALAGGFRLAFWAEERNHHGPRLERALARYERFPQARPPGWPTGGIAAFTRFLALHTRRQEGPEHGMAYDVQRFNELTKQMSAYIHYQRDGHLQLAAARAQRRARARRLAEQLNQPAAASLPHRREPARRPAAARLGAAGVRAPQPPGRRPDAVRAGRARGAARQARPAAAIGPAPGQCRRPLPRGLHLRRALGP